MNIRPSLAAFVVAPLVVACAGEPPPQVAPVPPPVVAAPPPVVAPATVAAAAPPPPVAPPDVPTKAIALPGVTGPATLDYIAADRARGRVWVPVGDTGSVDVLDVASLTFTRVDGFKTAQRESHGRMRMMGPSAADVGDGLVYVGNRATSEVCTITADTQKAGKCLKLPSATDGVAYVPSAKEVWVTTPRDSSLTILDASHLGALMVKATLKTPGSPEGYAVDDGRGLFYTNLEDKDQTLVFDVKTHTLVSTFASGCGADGPRGIAVDAVRGLLFVACTDKLQVMRAAAGSQAFAPVASLDTGAGVDNIDWLASRGLLYVAAGKAARLTVVRFDDAGQPTVVWTAQTAAGARNAVPDANGNAYVADAMHGGILVAIAPAK